MSAAVPMEITTTPATSSTSNPSLIPILANEPPSAQSQADVNQQLQQLTDSFQTRALAIIYEVIPTKVATIQSLVDKFQSKPCAEPVYTTMGAECNADIQEISAAMKIEIHALLSYIDPLRMWVSLNIPRIQDQKGVHVTVKEDLVEMLHSCKLTALGICENITKYHVSRGKLVSKMIKFPLSADHALCIAELDRKQYYLLVNFLNDIKNNYTLLYDMTTKNMSKLVRIQEENYHSMY